MIKNVLFLVILLYVTVVLSMYLLQRKMMYFPHEAPEHTHYEVLDIASDGLMIKVVTEGSQLEQAVIYFGGNGEDIYAGAERMQAAFIDRAAYYVNYPGYGGSSGSPTETTRETGDERRETRDGRRKTGDERRETGDERRETGDQRRATGVGR